MRLLLASSVLVIGCLLAPALGAEKKPKGRPTRSAATTAEPPVSAVDAIRESIERLHPDEPVLPVAGLTRPLPKRRMAEHPYVELKDFKFVNLADGTRELELTCRVIEGPLHNFLLILKSEYGFHAEPVELKQPGDVLIRFRSPWSLEPKGIEAWAELNDRHVTRSSKVESLGYKISKSVTVGTVKEISHPRHWNAIEEMRVREQTRYVMRPHGPPTGYQLVGETPLPPGMPVLYFLDGTWSSGEFIAFTRGVGWTIRLTAREQDPNFKGSKAEPILGHFDATRVAVSSRKLADRQQVPTETTASVRVLPGSQKALSDNLVAIPEGITILPGTPLYVEHTSKWNKVYAIAAPKEDHVLTISADEPFPFRHEWRYKLQQVAIEPATLAEFAAADAREVFAKRWQEIETVWAEHRRKNNQGQARDYLATYPLPEGYIALEDDAVVKKGDRFKITFNTRWETVTAVTVSEEGPVEIHWDRYGESRSWDQFLSRRSLFVVGDKPEKPIAELTDRPAPKSDRGGYRLILEDAGRRKIAVTKVVMKATGLDLRDARDAINETPVTLLQSLTQSAAEALAKELEAAGGKARVEERE